MATGIPKTQWNGNSPGWNDTTLEFKLDVQLAYEGKQSEDEILKLPPASYLQFDQVGEPINGLYCGDNLPILSSFLDCAPIYKQVKLIYIDPPFATNSIFKSRSQTDAYSDLLTGSHYIEFLRKRLILLRELLSDDGSIYIHLDENISFYVKIIMDELFGKKNFRNWITRKKCNPKNYTKKSYGNIADYILYYTKSESYTWNRPFESWTNERAFKEYQYIEEKTGRRYKKVPIHAPGVRQGETGKPWRGMNPPPGKHWQYPPATLEQMDDRGEIFWSKNGNPRRKVYLDESLGIPVQDIWLDCRDAHNQNIQITGYPTEKNDDLVTRIIRASSNPNDLVLDCFSGSGTTLAVADRQQRRWIGIDNSLEAIATTLQRFTQGTTLMGDFVQKDKPSDREEMQQMSLFDRPNLEDPISDKLSSNPNRLVNNFAIYGVESIAEELQEVVDRWRSGKIDPTIARSLQV